MKITSETLEILNSMSKINKSIYVEAGNIIKTHPEIGNSPTAKAVVEESFPETFAIYELKTFLTLINLFDEPDFEFLSDRVIITDGDRRATYRYCEPDNINHPKYDKDFVLPSVDANFKLSGDITQNLIKSTMTLKMPDIVFHGDGKNIYIKTYNSNLPANHQEKSDEFSVRIGETDRKFTMIFTTADFALIKKGDYNVELCFKGIAKLSNETMTYWVSPSSKSKYS